MGFLRIRRFGAGFHSERVSHFAASLVKTFRLRPCLLLVIVGDLYGSVTCPVLRVVTT